VDDGSDYEVEVYLGNKLDEKGEMYEVEKTIIHPDYYSTYSNTLYNDMTLLKLKRAIEWRSGVQPICLRSDSAYVAAGTNCIVSGWGMTDASDPNSGAYSLKKLTMPVLPFSSCRSSGLQEPIHFCAGYLEGYKDSCPGDSGGSLACPKNGRYFTEGVVSFGPGTDSQQCGVKNGPGIYARVSAFYNWIQSHIHGDCYEP